MISHFDVWDLGEPLTCGFASLVDARHFLWLLSDKTIQLVAEEFSRGSSLWFFRWPDQIMGERGLTIHERPALLAWADALGPSSWILLIRRRLWQYGNHLIPDSRYEEGPITEEPYMIVDSNWKHTKQTFFGIMYPMGEV